MDAAALTHYITTTFPGIQTAVSEGNVFFFYGPDGKVPERTFPFATLVTRDDYDHVSNLNREGVFRLNIGLGAATYERLLGAVPAAPKESGIVETGHDFAALDEIMPHPVYGHLRWVCVLNPGAATWATVQGLLAGAYEGAVGKWR